MKTYGYIRVSTEEQEVSGLGLEGQKREIVQKFGEVDGWFQDVLSGSTPFYKRDGFMSLLDVIGKGDRVVGHKRDRLSRDVSNLVFMEVELEKKGCKLVTCDFQSVEDDPQNRFFRHILDAISELERNVIRQRTRVGMKSLFIQRKRTSYRIPYGYDLDSSGTLVENEKEQSVICRILSCHSMGNSYNGISNELNRDKVSSKSGGKWYAKTVSNVIEYQRRLKEVSV